MRWSWRYVYILMLFSIVSFLATACGSSNENLLIGSSTAGDLAQVNTAIGAGANINAKDAAGDTALIHASEKGHSAVVEALLAAGADVNAKDNLGATALERASAFGHVDIVEALLAKGADVNSRTNSGSTPLMNASLPGYLDVVRILLSKGADASAKSNIGLTALMMAVGSPRPPPHELEVVQALLAAGVDVNARSTDGNTALLIASEQGELKVVKTLLAKGADARAVWTGGFGGTALIVASEKGHLEIVNALLAHGANVNAKRIDGTTSLTLASQEGHADVARALIAKGADVNSANNVGITALISSSAKGQVESVGLLLDRRANINAKGNGVTALIAASINGQPDVVDLLLNRGADTKINADSGFDALHEAARKFNFDVVSVFVEHNVNSVAELDAVPAPDRYDDVSVLRDQLSSPLPAMLSEGNIALVKGDHAVARNDGKSCKENFEHASTLWSEAEKHFDDVGSMYGREAAWKETKQILASTLISVAQQYASQNQQRQMAQVYALSHAHNTAQYSAMMGQYHPTPIVPIPTFTPKVQNQFGVFALNYVPGLENDPDTLENTFNDREKIARGLATVTKQSAQCCANASSGVVSTCFADLGKAVGLK